MPSRLFAPARKFRCDPDRGLEFFFFFEPRDDFAEILSLIKINRAKLDTREIILSYDDNEHTIIRVRYDFFFYR